MGGWSGYVDGKKKHYFHKDSKTSICGFGEINTAKVKSIFYKEDISTFHPKTVCGLCLREYKRIIGTYDPLIDCRNKNARKD